MSIPLEDQLLFQPHHTLKEILASECPVHVFVNPTEYHGPHLSLGNDRILSERIARKLHAELCQVRQESIQSMPFLVGGNIDFGCDPCPGKGSTSVTYNRLKSMVQTLADGLVKIGVKKIIFHTFHGSPFHNHAIHSVIDRLAQQDVRAVNVFDLVIQMILEFDPERYEPVRKLLDSDATFERVLASLPFDTHAGFFETSIALSVAPETVSDIYLKLPDCPDTAPGPTVDRLMEKLHPIWHHAHELGHSVAALNWTKLKPFPGYTGIPSLASKEVGEFYVNQLILPQYKTACLNGLWGDGSIPQTPFAWTKPLAPLFGGRF